jgi:hypothetical protein
MQTIRTPENGQRFFAALREFHGYVTKAAQSVGLSRTALYAWRDEDEAFRDMWLEVVDETTEELELEAWRRAHDGVDKDIFYQGEKIATETNYSDALLMFTIKSRKPEQYRDNSKVELGGIGGQPLVIEVEFIEEKPTEPEV